MKSFAHAFSFDLIGQPLPDVQLFHQGMHSFVHHLRVITHNV